MRIPDEMWHCPECGAGYNDGKGLCGPEFTTYEEYVDEYGEADAPARDEYGYAECYACGWEGHVTEIVEAYQQQHSRVRCPHCNGTGWIQKEEVQHERHNDCGPGVHREVRP